MREVEVVECRLHVVTESVEQQRHAPAGGESRWRRGRSLHQLDLVGLPIAEADTDRHDGPILGHLLTPVEDGASLLLECGRHGIVELEKRGGVAYTDAPLLDRIVAARDHPDAVVGDVLGTQAPPNVLGEELADAFGAADAEVARDRQLARVGAHEECRLATEEQGECRGRQHQHHAW